MTTQDNSQRDIRGAFAAADAAAVWQQSASQRAAYLGPATDRMLALADLRPGARVLDVAAGTGEQSLPAARRIGPTGALLAIDLTASMLEVAAAAAREAGLGNLEVRVMDAHNLDLDSGTFDAAISRLGIMLFAEPRRALVEIHRVLKPDAKFAVMVWSQATRNPAVSIPAGILRGLLGESVPPGGENGMFSLGDPSALMDLFTGAGFGHVHVETLALERRHRDLPQLVEHSLVLHNLLGRLPAAATGQAFHLMEEGLTEFACPEGYLLPGEVHLAVGTV